MSHVNRAGSRFRESQPLVPVLAAFAMGIVLDRTLFVVAEPQTSLTWPLLGWLVGVLAAVGAWRSLLSRSERGASFFLMGAVLAAGGAWHHAFWNLYPQTEIGLAVGEGSLAMLEGKIVRPPEYYGVSDDLPKMENSPEWTTSVEFRVLRAMDKAEWHKASGRILLRIQGDLRGIHVGDTVRVSGKLFQPDDARNFGAFSPRAFYRQKRILTLMKVPSPGNVEKVHSPRVPGPFRMAEYLRDTARKRLERFLTPEEKPLANALVLGCREEVPRSDKETMLETGTIHLLAISGLHVGLLAWGFFSLLKLLAFPRVGIPWVVTLLVILYVMMTGARPPAIRAGILVVVTVLAYGMGRPVSRLNTLCAAGLFVLAINPLSLFSAGTQLSFLAVGTLLHTPLFSPKRRDTDEDNWEYWFADPTRRPAILRSMAKFAAYRLASIFYASFLMMLVLLPLVANQYHVIALAGLFLNVLLWLPLLMAMMSAALVILMGWIPGVGTLCGAVCSSSIWLLKTLIDAGAAIPGHCFWTEGVPFAWMTVFYLVLMLGVVWLPFRPGVKKATWVLLLLVLFLLVCPGWMQPRRETLRCTFLSVSHGLCVVLELPDGRNLMFDAGQFADASVPERTISQFLWHRHIWYLDAIFLSHPDMDHYNAIPGLLEKFSVGKLYTTPQSLAAREKTTEATTDHPYYAARQLRETPTENLLAGLFHALEKHRVPVETLVAGDVIPLADDCTLEVLHPQRNTDYGSTNAASMVLLLAYRDFRILLTGDLAPPGLDAFLTQEPISCDVLLSPHHGGRTCNTPSLAKWSHPKWVVISEAYSLPQPQTTERFRSVGAQIHHTGREGAVAFVFRKDKMEVETIQERQK
ncbi:MAG: ComEC/Rec2 family competence protein [Planctomycetia bacterium]|nr:ComEC/Rec2 family competence protein [Planctomycetia bacterium]